MKVSWLQKAVAEFIGTFALVFVGCGCIMVNERLPGTVAIFTIPAVFGLVVTCMVYTVGHISGAHLNPAVTLAFALVKHFPKNEIILYWAAQLSGAITASGVLALLLPSGVGYGATHAGIGLYPSLGIEIIVSFLLMFVVMAVATDARAEGPLAGVAVGGIVTVCAYVGGPLTGASMNPARSIAPALFENNFSDLWIYILGPCLGMILAAAVYQWIRHSPSEN